MALRCGMAAKLSRGLSLRSGRKTPAGFHYQEYITRNKIRQ
jgi:hypothetical protein